MSQHVPSSTRTTHPIRPLVLADLDAVVELSLLAWAPVFASFERVVGTTIFDLLHRPDWRTEQAAAVRRTCLTDGWEPFVLAEEDEAPVGFVVLRQEPERSLGVVEMLAVHPDHQRRGHARALMHFAVDRLQSQGLRLINVGTGGDPGHAPARALYEAVGFTPLPVVAYFRAAPGQERTPMA